MNREPVVIISIVASSIIAVLEAVGNDLFVAGISDSLITIIQAVVVIAGIVLARSQVTPVGSN